MASVRRLSPRATFLDVPFCIVHFFISWAPTARSNMTGNIITEDSAPGIGGALLSGAHSNIIHFLDSARLYSNILANKIKNVFLGGYSGVQTAIHYIIHLASRLKITTSDESSRRYFQPVIRHQAAESTQRTPFRDYNPLTLEAGQRPVALNEAPSTRLKRPRMAADIIGLLVLSMLPGVILGAVTGQVEWGISLSGAIATVLCGVRAACYHCK